MPRNISFALTTDQVRKRTKTVTRRNGWKFLKAGEILCAVEKSQGIPKGGKVKRIGMIRVISVRHETLREMINRPRYGKAECEREGFPDKTPDQFGFMFCRTHKGVKLDSEITRIEFEYLDAPAKAEAA